MSALSERIYLISSTGRTSVSKTEDGSSNLSGDAKLDKIIKMN
ncbi:MAG: hypothetical protein ACTSSH_00190 [Candidatus Heimdallarchaeota archaeon]